MFTVSTSEHCLEPGVKKSWPNFSTIVLLKPILLIVAGQVPIFAVCANCK